MHSEPIGKADEAAPASDAPKVLVVDDDAQARLLFRRVLSKNGFAVDEAFDGLSALSAVTMGKPDVVILDVNLPRVNGFEVCQRLKQDHATRLTPVVFVTALSARDDRLRGLEVGADEFLTKPVDQQELLTRVRAAARLKRYTDDLDSAASIIMTLATMMEARDGTEGHCFRMANYATSLGRTLRLAESQLQALYRGGFLHDLGMLAIPDAVLRKPGPLSADEYDLVKSHTVVGDRLCANLHSLRPVRPIIRSHHERLDGSGYPDGLAGDQVPLLAQIIGIVDTFEAVTMPRPYQPTVSARVAVELLRDHVNRGWRDRDLVDTFIALVEAGKLSCRSPS